MSADIPGGHPWLTVVIPSHRGERWLNTSLLSLAAQHAQGIEVLLIDSGDTPAARDVARKYSNLLRMHIFKRADLLSWHTKTNFGVEMAASEHVCWLGVDDIWLPGRAAAARAWIKAAPESPLHFAPCQIIGEDGSKQGVWRCPLPEARPLDSNFVAERLLIQNYLAAPAPVFRKDAWLSCGGLDENLWYTADWDMWLKLASSATTYYHSEVTVGFRIHSASLTTTGSRNPAELSRQMKTVLERHLPRLKINHSKAVERAARASIAVNTALASASAGNFSTLPCAALQVAGLGPSGIGRYFRDSRIVERLLPRVRAKLRRSL
jgi:hypothetical protein